MWFDLLKLKWYTAFQQSFTETCFYISCRIIKHKDSVGEGEAGMIWENGIETCILSCKKWIASLGSIQDTGCLGLVHGDEPERWYGETGGRGVQDWQYMYTCGGFMSMYGKTNTVL